MAYLSSLKSNEWCSLTGHTVNLQFMCTIWVFQFTLNILPVSVTHPSSLMT